MSVLSAWLLLILAGLFEVGFTTFLKLSQGFTRLWPSLGFMLCAAVSFWLLTKATLHIPLGTAYAVWTGIGVMGTVLVGIIAYHDSTSLARILCLLMLITAIIGLKVSS